MRKITVLSTIIVLLTDPFGKVTASAQTAIDEQAVQTFPASVDGFRSQFNSVVEAYRVGGQAEGRRALELFQLPRSEEWLIEHLGPDPNGEFTNRYNRIFLSFESSLEKTIEDVQRTRNAKLLVSIDSTKQEMAPHPILGRKLSGIRIVKEPPLFYCHFTIQVKGRNAVLWADKFTYEAGAFRFIGFGTQPFWVWQDGSEGAGPREGYFVRLPILVSRVSPMYPTAALGKDGVVIVHYFVDEKGRVKNPTVVTGDPVFTQAAIDAVLQWRYKPATIGGVPIEIDATAALQFRR